MSPIHKAQEIHAMKKQNRRQFLCNLLLHSLVALTCSFIFSSYPHLFSSLSTSFSLKSFLFISLPQIWSSMFNPKCLFIVVNVIVIFLVGESKIGNTNSSPVNEIYKEYVERSQSQCRRACATTSRGEKRMNVKVLNNDIVVVGNMSPAKEICKESVEKIQSFPKVISSSKSLTSETKKKMDVKMSDESDPAKEPIGRIQSRHRIVSSKSATSKTEEKMNVKINDEVDAIILPSSQKIKNNIAIGCRDIVTSKKGNGVKEKLKGVNYGEENNGMGGEDLNKRAEEFIARVNKQRRLEHSFLLAC